MLRLDHIVVSAASLEAGRSHVESLLGVPLQTGGKHDLMGTHNLLLGLEDGLYLEVIAIDPDAPHPGRNRWFGLDDFSGPPRLTNWVGRSDDLVGDMERAFGVGSRPTHLARGDLSWDMSVIEAGQTPFDGLVPMMLDWGQGPKAADRLAPSGCRLKKLLLGYPEQWALADVLAGFVDEPLIGLEFTGTPTLTAILETPKGEVILR